MYQWGRDAVNCVSYIHRVRLEKPRHDGLMSETPNTDVMDRLGIVDLLSLGATLVFALPIGVVSAGWLFSGRPVLGAIGVSVAIGLVAVERLLWTPEDLPADLLQGIVGRIVRRPPEND